MTYDTDLTEKPITIDTQAIAEGLYELFDQSERACLAFGMLPEAKLSIMRKHLVALARNLWPSANRVFSATELADMRARGLDIEAFNRPRVTEARKTFVEAVEHQVCLDLYGVAPMVA